MGFMDKMKAALAEASKPQTAVPSDDTPDTLTVVGTSHYQDELRMLTWGDDEFDEDDLPEALGDRNFDALVSFDPTNEFDKNAIKVTIEDVVIGYVGKNDQARIAPYLKRNGGEVEGYAYLIGGIEGKSIGVRVDF